MSLPYKILRYIAQATIIYLLLRYLPYLSLSANKALISTLIIIVLSLALEQLCSYYYTSQPTANLEGFSNNGSCACAVESFNGVGEKKEGTPTEVKKEEKVGATTTASGKEGQTNGTLVGSDIVDKPEVRVVDTDNGDIYKGIDKMPAERDLSDLPVKDKVNDDRFYWGSRYGNLGYDTRYGFGGMFYDEYPFYNRFRNNDYEALDNIGGRYPLQVDGAEAVRKDQEREDIERVRLDDRAKSIDGYKSRYQEVGSKSERLKTLDNNRRIEGPLDDEIPYSDYNHLPVAAGYRSSAAEYGYSYLPPASWYPQPPRAPICVTEKRSVVLPVYTDSTTADLKEFYSASRITPPDLISTDYINDKLNSGR